MEFHLESGLIHDESVGDQGWFGIGYGMLLSGGSENLFFTGRTIGADHHAHTSIRMTGTSFVAGHASGVEEALRAGQKWLDALRVQSILEKQGAALQV